MELNSVQSQEATGAVDSQLRKGVLFARIMGRAFLILAESDYLQPGAGGDAPRQNKS
jgi:hypothetical protein